MSLDRRDVCVHPEIKSRGSKNVSIDPSPRYYDKNSGTMKNKSSGFRDSEKFYGEFRDGNNEKFGGVKMSSARMKDLRLSKNSCFYQDDDIRCDKKNEILSGTNRRELFTKNHEISQQDSKQLRYIQSAKGTWSYNL